MRGKAAEVKGHVTVKLVIVAMFSGFIAAFVHTPPAAAAVNCSALHRAVFDRVNPRTQVNSLTINKKSSGRTIALGFSWLRGTPFSASADPAAGLSIVSRLVNAKTGDQLLLTDPGEIQRKVKSKGYRIQARPFYLATQPASCLIPVYSFVRHNIHRYQTLPAERAALVHGGWTEEGVAFYAGPPPLDPTFSIAVIPDTQQEVLRARDPRFLNRTTWLANSKAALDIRFVTHTGDVVNWDTPNHDQYRVAQTALARLGTAMMPYSISPGNHDTAAVCYGGGACNSRKTRALVRNTTTFNTYLNGGTTNMAGQFERGKLDNTFATFTAGGLQWLVLNLELWPRSAVVSWAGRVVANHPRDNVMVVTHSYLTGSGAIYQKSDYGTESPQYLFDHLIKVYPNIRLVFSGHAGKSAQRQDHGVHGNLITSLLLTMHDNRTNPLRMVQINTAKNTLQTWVYSPYTNTNYPKYSRQYSGLSWVR